jgi:hypothetical protein
MKVIKGTCLRQTNKQNGYLISVTFLFKESKKIKNVMKTREEIWTLLLLYLMRAQSRKERDADFPSTWHAADKLTASKWHPSHSQLAGRFTQFAVISWHHISNSTRPPHALLSLLTLLTSVNSLARAGSRVLWRWLYRLLQEISCHYAAKCSRPIFCFSSLCTDQIWGPSSLLSNEYRGSFPGGKARLGRDADPLLVPR